VTSASVSNKSDQILLLKVASKRNTIFFIMWSSLWLVTLGTSPAQVLKSTKHLESGDFLMDYSLAELKFVRYLPFWVPLFMQYNNTYLTYSHLKTPFFPIFSAAKLVTILNVLAFKTTRSLKSSPLKVVIEASVMYQCSSNKKAKWWSKWNNFLNL